NKGVATDKKIVRFLFCYGGFVMDDQMKNGAAAYGCFLIIPLKYERDSFKQIQLEKIGRSEPVTTMDLNENIKAMLSPGDETAAGTGYIISRDALTAQMTSGEDRDAVKDFRVIDKSGVFCIELRGTWLIFVC